MNIINVKNVTVKYRTGNKIIKAIDNISIAVETGECLCIIGSNGSGKSSLLKAILGLVPISNGTINLSFSKNEIAYLPQTNTISSDFPATVYEIVLSGTQKNKKGLPFYKKQDHIDAQYILESLEILKFKSRRFGELSGGQQQRVLLARALVRKPKILFLDEPCSGLDEAISKHFYSILEDLNKNQKITIVMVSHDSLQIERYATNVLHLAKEAIFCGTINHWLSVSKRISCIH